MTFENGKKLEILAPENNSTNCYIKSVKLNGKPIDVNYIRHQEILNGGRLSFRLGNAPDTKRNTGKEAYPYSMH